jgi:hypothetical protein
VGPHQNAQCNFCANANISQFASAERVASGYHLKTGGTDLRQQRFRFTVGRFTAGKA